MTWTSGENIELNVPKNQDFWQWPEINSHELEFCCTFSLPGWLFAYDKKGFALVSNGCKRKVRQQGYQGLPLVTAREKWSQVATICFFLSFLSLWLVGWLVGWSVSWLVCALAFILSLSSGRLVFPSSSFLSVVTTQWKMNYSNKSLPQIQLPHSLNPHFVAKIHKNDGWI